jgi:chromosome segregation ATPase
MTTAILEILALLIVSCAIGIFFTYRYWKSRYHLINNDLESSQEENAQLRNQISSQEKEISELASEVDNLKKDLEKASKKGDRKSAIDETAKGEIKELKEKIELQEQELNEKEREIEVLSDELAAKKISYYKQIDGKRYKAITLMKADEAIAGQGDGRISKADAEEIFSTISDGKSYTQVEKHTMRYLRDHYNWTEEADALFRTKVRSWAAKGHELDK